MDISRKKEVWTEMRLLIISDNHGSMDEFYHLMKQQINYDTVIHLGDGGIRKWEYEKYMPQCMPFICIKGNNDYGMDFPDRFCAKLGEYQVAAIHGDRLQVKTTLEPLERWGRKEQAALVCYGHTHKADIQVRDNMLLLNPGSLSGRHSVTGQTYAIADMTKDGIYAEIFRIEGRKSRKIAGAGIVK